MLLSNDAEQIDHILCVLILPEVGNGSKWAPGEVSVSTLRSALGCIGTSCAQPSVSGCCWQPRFELQFQPQDVNEITENPSQFPRIWWKRGAVGWVVGKDTLSKPSPQWHRDSSAQRLGLCLRCMAGVCEPSSVCLWLSSRLMQKHALKKAVVMLLQNAALMYPLTAPRKPSGCLCTACCCTTWVEASSHTWISGVSTLH